MLRVLGCITSEHDLRLVVLAALICATACYTSFSLIARATSLDPSRRLVRHGWLAAAAFVTGSGVWATHFVAELAFRPGLPVAFDVNLTALSVVIAIVVSGVGIAIRVHDERYALLGGAVVGLAVGAMHYTGMAALRLPADLVWDYGYVAASLIVGVTLSAVASWFDVTARPAWASFGAAGILLLAIVGLHFTGMAAVQILPDPRVLVPRQSIQPELLAIAISAVTILIIALGLFGSIVDQHLAQRNEREAAELRRYVAALEATRQDLELTATKLRVALDAKSRFLATMSHELRTPLNAIIGFSEILESEAFGPVGNPRYKSYHADIHHSGQHLLALINDILDICKLDAAQVSLREREFDPGILLANCVREFAPQAAKSGIALSLSPAPSDVIVLADAIRLRQVVVNLLSNAVKFTADGGRIEVRSRASADAYEIAIIDTGIGMAPGDIPKALERFGHIDSSLARKYEGAGLGLPIARQMVELHGGTLAIDSAPNCGTTVRVTLPGWRARTADKAA